MARDLRLEHSTADDAGSALPQPGSRSTLRVKAMMRRLCALCPQKEKQLKGESEVQIPGARQR